MTTSTTVPKLTTQKLQQWQEWYLKELHPLLTPFNEVQQPGEFLVVHSRYKPAFIDLGGCLVNTFAVDKVTKLKVGNAYRSNLSGWVVPAELVDTFHQCRKVSTNLTATHNQR